MFRSSNDPDGALVLGMGAGVWLFFRGFRTFRKYRLVADTPEIPIRSIPMGLVKVRGKASGPKTIPSPVSQTPCYFYQVNIERWESQERERGWKHYCTDQNGVPFYVQDATGKVQVDAHTAELDLPQVGTNIADSSHTSDTNTALLQYISGAQVGRLTNFVAGRLEKHGPSADPRRENARLAMLEMLGAARGAAMGDAGSMGQAMEHLLQSSGPLADPAKEQRRQAMLANVQLVEAAVAGGLQLPMNNPTASGRFRLTEYCVLPDQEYEVTGTCMENPKPQDEHDRNLIARGQNERTFLISFKAEPQLESGLRWRAVLSIVGGAALTLFCLALLLARYHYF